MAEPQRLDERRRGVSPRVIDRISGRLSLGHVVMIVAGLLAVLVNFLVLRSRDEVFLVAVAAGPIRAGTTVSADDLALTELQATPEVLAGLVSGEERGMLEGRIAVRAIAAGDLLHDSDFREPSAPADLRAMSIPIEREHAAGGDLEPGDVVDVIRASDQTAEYVVAGAQVLDVATDSDSALRGVSRFFVVVAVDADTALELASAIQSGGLELVRSTGAVSPQRLRIGEQEEAG